VIVGKVVAGRVEPAGEGVELVVADGVGEGDEETLPRGTGAAGGRTGTAARPDGFVGDGLAETSGTLARTSSGSAPSREGGS
jgi:hypothetical protein